jgi:hypothetical protein
VVEILHHRRGQLGLTLPHHLIRHFTFRPPGCVGVGKPGLWQEEPFVDQGIALARRIGRKHPDLTVLDLPQGATVLASHPHGIGAFFHEPRFIDDQHAIGLAHLVLDQAMIRFQHRRFIPQRIADEALHGPHLAALYLQGHRFDGFTFQGAELAYHIVEKLVPRFLAGETCPKGGVEPAEFVHKRVDIAPGERKLGNGNHLVCRPTRR